MEDCQKRAHVLISSGFTDSGEGVLQLLVWLACAHRMTSDSFLCLQKIPSFNILWISSVSDRTWWGFNGMKSPQYNAELPRIFSSPSGSACKFSPYTITSFSISLSSTSHESCEGRKPRSSRDKYYSHPYTSSLYVLQPRIKVHKQTVKSLIQPSLTSNPTRNAKITQFLLHIAPQRAS